MRCTIKSKRLKINKMSYQQKVQNRAEKVQNRAENRCRIEPKTGAESSRKFFVEKSHKPLKNNARIRTSDHLILTSYTTSLTNVGDVT